MERVEQLGPAGTMPLFAQDGSLHYVPGENVPRELSKGSTLALYMTSPEGHTALVPGPSAGKALKAGFKVGPAFQQNLVEHKSFVPQAAMPALNAIQKYVNDPLNRMSAAGAKMGGEVVLDMLANPPLDPFGALDYQTRQQRTREFEQSHPRIAGMARGVGETVGGAVADPRMWPFLFAGPEVAGGRAFLSRAVSPTLQRAASIGFAAQMASGAVSQAAVVKEIWNRPDVPLEQKYEAITNLVLSAMMTAMAAKRGATPRAPGANNVPQLNEQLAQQIDDLGPKPKQEIFKRVKEAIPSAEPPGEAAPAPGPPTRASRGGVDAPAAPTRAAAPTPLRPAIAPGQRGGSLAKAAGATGASPTPLRPNLAPGQTGGALPAPAEAAQASPAPLRPNLAPGQTGGALPSEAAIQPSPESVPAVPDENPSPAPSQPIQDEVNPLEVAAAAPADAGTANAAAQPEAGGAPESGDAQALVTPRTGPFEGVGRTAEANAEAHNVADAMDAINHEPGRSTALFGTRRAQSITVLTHQDGSVSVGVSGITPDEAGLIEDRLNAGLENPKYRVRGDVDEELAGKLKDVRAGTVTPTNCSEPRAASAAHEINNDETNPTTGYDTIQRPDTKADRLPLGDPDFPERKRPCDNCSHPPNAAAMDDHANMPPNPSQETGTDDPSQPPSADGAGSMPPPIF
jgi:hypothetical protein